MMGIMPMKIIGPEPIILDAVVCADYVRKVLKRTLRAWHLGAFCAFSNSRRFYRKDQQGELGDREARQLVRKILKAEALWKQNREALELVP